MTHHLVYFPALQAEQLTVPPPAKSVAVADSLKLRLRSRRNLTQLNATLLHPTEISNPNPNLQITIGPLMRIHM